jgi:hypothetical protein
MSGRGAGVLFAVFLGSTALLQQPAAVPQVAPAPDILAGTQPLAITLEAPLHELFAKDDDENFSVRGTLSYQDPGSGAELKREAHVSVRGHTSRRETECTFPKLKLKFKEGGVLKIGTHCGEAADEALSPKYGRLANERSPQREALAYRLLQAAGVPSLRVRPASVTYVEAGQAPLTRKALLVEDDDAAKARLGGRSEIPMETFGSVRTRGAETDAGRIAFGQAMIGNFDWCLKFAPDDIYRCNEPKPLWNVLAFDRGDGTAALVIKDFDLAGIVAGRHAWFNRIFNPAFVPSRSEVEIEVLSQVQRTRSLFPRTQLDALRRSFLERKPAIYAALDQTDVDAKGREVARAYLDGFFAAIADDPSYYRPVIAKGDVRIYADAERSREACGAGDLVRPGTPVNVLQRSGAMSQVVILDALWRWTAERRCETVQSSPVWVQSDAISAEYPPRN